jgi:pyruvate dehydrogenase E1 component
MTIVQQRGPIRDAAPAEEARRLRALHALERKLLWLSAWMIHHANHASR